jgi:hypothetical protein
MKRREESVRYRHGQGIVGCGGRRNTVVERERLIARQVCCVVFEEEPDAARCDVPIIHNTSIDPAICLLGYSAARGLKGLRLK